MIECFQERAHKKKNVNTRIFRKQLSPSLGNWIVQYLRFAIICYFWVFTKTWWLPKQAYRLQVCKSYRGKWRYEIRPDGRKNTLITFQTSTCPSVTLENINRITKKEALAFRTCISNPTSNHRSHPYKIWPWYSLLKKIKTTIIRL